MAVNTETTFSVDACAGAGAVERSMRRVASRPWCRGWWRHTAAGDTRPGLTRSRPGDDHRFLVARPQSDVGAYEPQMVAVTPNCSESSELMRMSPYRP
jgi:hypothetical protein